jgi:hypothetical protein
MLVPKVDGFVSGSYEMTSSGERAVCIIWESVDENLNLMPVSEVSDSN